MAKMLQLSLIFSLLTASLQATSSLPEDNLSTVKTDNAASLNPSYLKIKKEKLPSLAAPIILGITGGIVGFLAIMGFMSTNSDYTVKQVSFYLKMSEDAFKSSARKGCSIMVFFSAVLLGSMIDKIFKRNTIKKAQKKRKKLKAAYKQDKIALNSAA